MTTDTLKDEMKEFCDSYSIDVDSDQLFTEMCQLKQVHKANINSSGDIVKPLDLLNKITQLKLSNKQSLSQYMCGFTHLPNTTCYCGIRREVI